MKKKTTLLVTCWFPNDDNPQWGTFVLDHAKSLLTSEYRPSVLFIHIHSGNGFFNLSERTYKIDDIPVLKIEITSRLWKFLYQWPFFLKRKILRLSKHPFITEADIIHSHALFPAGFFGYQLSRKLKKPFVLTEHWTRAGRFLKNHPLGYYGKRIYKRAQAVIFVSESLKNKISRIAKPRHSFVVPNPIDGLLFHYTPKPSFPPVKFTLIAFWKKDGVKRGDLILEAFKELKEKEKLPFQIDFVGLGTALESYRQLAEKYELPVSFCGFEDKKKLARHLQESHFLIHPTEMETFGIVVFEALKTGTPVLVSDLELFRPFIHPENGMLVKNEVSAWHDAILTAFRKHFNHEKIAREYETPFSEKEVADKTQKVYETVFEKVRKKKFFDL